MTEFPPISKEDNAEVLIHFVNHHFQETGEIINLNSILEIADGGSLRVARKRKSKKSASEVVDEPKSKKHKQPRRALILNVVETTLPLIQEEVDELEPFKVLKSRTRGGTVEAASTQPGPRIQNKRRTVRKLKESQYIEDESTEIEMSSIVSDKPLTEAQEASLVEKPVKVASGTIVPTSSLVKKRAKEDAAKVVVLTEEMKGLASNEL